MSDLISRQAAIEAVCSVCGNTECNIFDTENKAKLFCPEPYAISKLPSAEPEIKWIPVSERLPEDRRMVLVTFRGPDGKPWVRQGHFGAGLSEKWGYYDVIAWAEMPEPYKGDHSEQ